MSIDKQSGGVMVVSLGDEPALTKDLDGLVKRLSEESDADVVVDFSGVSFFNSADITKLLKVRRLVDRNERRMVLCGANINVRGVLMITALDKTFEMTADLQAATAWLAGDTK